MEATARSHPHILGRHGATASGTVAPAAIDWTAIARIIHLQQPGCPSVLATIIESYRQATPTAIDNLENSIAHNALEQARDIAHSLKSSSENVGAMYLTQCFSGIERAATAGDTIRCRLLLQDARGEFTAVIDRLTSYARDAA